LIPGRPALSVKYDHIEDIPKNVAASPSSIGAVNDGSHWSCGTRTRNMAIGWIKHIAHAFLIDNPSVVVRSPNLKLVKIIIPSVTYMNESSGFAKTTFAAIPINEIASHDMLPNKDMCNALEYSLFRISPASIFCVTSNTPIMSGIRNTSSSCLCKYASRMKYALITEIITENISE
jgi:hypothetical protein